MAASKMSKNQMRRAKKKEEKKAKVEVSVSVCFAGACLVSCICSSC